MDLSSISNSSNFKSYNLTNTQKSDKNQPTQQNNNSLPSKNSMAEAIGRSQVHFGAKEELSQSDKSFIKGLTSVFRADKKEQEALSQYTIKFLKEKNANSLLDFQSDDPFEYANEIAVYTENIAKILDLGDEESISLDMLLCEHLHVGDITEPKYINGASIADTYKYTKDEIPLEHILTKYLDEKQSNEICNYLSKNALASNSSSIFELFTDEMIPLGKSLFDNIADKLQIEQDKRGDILIDLYEMAKTEEKDRTKNINKHSMRENFEIRMRTIPIAQSICDMYHIEMSEKLLDLIDKRKTKAQVNKNGISKAGIAFTIADKYNLPQGAEKRIEKIIETYDEVKTEQQISQELFQILTREDN